MHIEQMNQDIGWFLDAARRLALTKNRDYHPDKVAMLEILQTAWETNITVEQDLWARIRKQMSALRRFVIEGHTESETVTSRLTDVAVYMAILDFWFKNRRQCILDAFQFVLLNRSCEYDAPSLVLGKPVAYCGKTTCERCEFLKWLDNYAYTLPSSGA